MSKTDLSTTRTALNGIAAMVDDALSDVFVKRLSFSLFIWPENETGRVNYVSNADRDEVKNALRELLNRWDEIKHENPKPDA